MTTPDLASYDLILASSSAGKDSQAMLDVLVEQTTAAGVRDRLVVVHCDLGRAEWGGTRELAEEQARHYGLRFEVVSRPQGDLLQHVEAMGFWPKPDSRYCTSDHKRGQVHRVITRLVNEMNLGRRARVLNPIGLRAEESPARAKLKPFSQDNRATNGRRQVDLWLPIHDWTTEQVWARIRQAGTRHHRAYDLGMSRLSCVFCIYAPYDALLLAGSHNRELLDEYVRIEAKIGHDFKHRLPLLHVRQALDRGEAPSGPIASWKM